VKPVLCIAGPTASGKSAWAVSIAKRFEGEVINADAMQVYRDLLILSARPRKDDMQNIPHHMYGHVDGNIRYSTGQWVREVQDVILDVLARDKTPVLVGGTGLYFKALTEGLAEIPQPDPCAIDEANQILETQGIAALRDKAEILDPVASVRILGNDPQRLLRIVSVALGTSAPLSHWHSNTRPFIPKKYWMGAKLLPDRAALYQRINQRFDAMIDQGGLEEVRKLDARALSPMLPVMKAIGVQQMMPALTDARVIGDGLELSKRDTRRFAKRQFTWLRGNMASWYGIENKSDKAAFERDIERRLATCGL